MNNQQYQLFDGDDQTFELVVTSNANIRKVCRVLTQCKHLGNDERIYYAQHGDIPPEKYDDDGRALYTFENIYNAATMWPALAMALFYDFPDIVEINDEGRAVIPKGDLYKKNENLIRSEVARGRDDFLSGFGVNPFEAKKLSDWLTSGQTPEIINQLMNPLQVPEDIPGGPATRPTSKPGESSSGGDTDSGQQSSG